MHYVFQYLYSIFFIYSAHYIGLYYQQAVIVCQLNLYCNQFSGKV